MPVDLDDEEMDGYQPLEEFMDEDQDSSSARIRDMPYGKRKEELNILTPTLTFASLTKFQHSAAQTAMAQNVGYDSVFVQRITVVGEFALSAMASPTPEAPLEILPGEMLVIPVIFSPRRIDPITGGIYLDLGDASGERFIKLIGTGAGA